MSSGSGPKATHASNNTEGDTEGDTEEDFVDFADQNSVIFDFLGLFWFSAVYFGISWFW